MTEKELIAACVKADTKAQRYVYETFGPQLMGICLRYTANREDAEEVFHDSLISVFTNISKFNSNSSLQTWINRIGMNKSIDFLRKQKKAILLHSVSLDEVESEDLYFEEEQCIKAEAALKVMQKLSLNHQLLINMALVDEFSHKEIATKLGITEEASRAMLSRAKKALLRLTKQILEKMKSKRQLNNLYKEAFSNHAEPLRELQWERIQADLEIRKNKKKPMMLRWSLLLLLFLTATIGFWFVFSTNSNKVSSTKLYSIPNEANSDVDQINSTQVIIDKPKIELHHNNEIHTYYTKNKSVHPNTKLELLPSRITLNPISDKIKENYTVVKKDTAQASQESKTDEIIVMNKIEQKVEDSAFVLNNGSDSVFLADASIKKMEKIKNTNQFSGNNKGISVSFVSGASILKNQFNNLSNSQKQHQDTRSLFELNNKKMNAIYFNLNVDFNLSKKVNLGFNTGIQVIQNSSKVDLNYEYNKIPFFNPDGTILGYVTPTVPEKYNYSSNNNTTVACIPLAIKYTWISKPKIELTTGLGLNLRYTAGASGKYLDLNSMQIEGLNKKNFNALGLGYQVSVQYQHVIKRNWWLGIESGSQINSQKFNLGNTQIKSYVNAINTAFIIKYKI